MTNSNAENEPAYDALWHLKVMGLMEADRTSKAWPSSSPTTPTRVALIDISVATGHPNLEGAIARDLAFDLFSTRLGAFPYRDHDALIGPGIFRGSKLALPAGLPLSSALQTELETRISERPALLGVPPATGDAFSSHGTASAGLLGARPAKMVGNRQAGQPAEVILPYVGCDPHCEVVPISTSLDPDPEPLILALLYADFIGADVILLPRDVPDPRRSRPVLDKVLFEAIYPVRFSPEEEAMWDELAELLVVLSRKIPIVCAAGNSQEVDGAYPASLAADDNGIISVGAVNGFGEISAYSASGNLTAFAPSSDGERYDNQRVRYDPFAPNDNTPLREPQPAGFKGIADTFSVLDIVTTDAPGRDGYTGSAYVTDRRPDNSIRDIPSYFTRFGGTSAASALIAGFISAGLTAGNINLGSRSRGIGIKTWLKGKMADRQGKPAIPTWNGSVPQFPGK